ncbi:hypothetical protein VF21_06628 [Pseudogymnoascus sp. 05NY08]|nr:hypothetical protein VF21_06628 [Pseudogymnoascus sp. 05NY08]
MHIAHTTGAQTAPPPYQPPSHQMHRGTQTTPSICTPPAPPPAPAPPPPPPTTFLEKLKKFDAALKEYAPVVGSIFDTLSPVIFLGSFMVAVFSGFMAWMSS